MVKYLFQLLEDIEQSIELAEQLPTSDWFPDFEDDDEERFSATSAIKIGDIYDIPAEAFPPERMLTDVQVIQLLDGIQRLWSSWRLWWDLPRQLSDRQQYSAMCHAMQHERVTWSIDKGGDVSICQFEADSYCPFGKEGGYCYCKELDDSVKHDIALWEEHVRSQGLDPYRELSEEEGAAFEEEMRVRNLRKQYGDDWDRFTAQDFFVPNGEPITSDMLSSLIVEDDDWMDVIFVEDVGKAFPADDAEKPSSKGYDMDTPSEDCGEENDFDLPMF